MARDRTGMESAPRKARRTIGNLLNEDEGIILKPALARGLGSPDAAVVVTQFDLFIKNFGREYDGRSWVRATQKNWQKQFHWVSERTLRRIFGKLQKRGILLRRRESAYQDEGDWYSIDYDAEAPPEIEPVAEPEEEPTPARPTELNLFGEPLPQRMRKHRLADKNLLDNKIMVIEPNLAAVVGGSSRALILRQIWFLQELHKWECDGRFWVYNRHEDWWQRHFSWMPIGTMRRYFSELQSPSPAGLKGRWATPLLHTRPLEGDVGRGMFYSVDRYATQAAVQAYLDVQPHQADAPEMDEFVAANGIFSFRPNCASTSGQVAQPLPAKLRKRFRPKCASTSGQVAQPLPAKLRNTSGQIAQHIRPDCAPPNDSVHIEDPELLLKQQQKQEAPCAGPCAPNSAEQAQTPAVVVVSSEREQSGEPAVQVPPEDVRITVLRSIGVEPNAPAIRAALAATLNQVQEAVAYARAKETAHEIITTVPACALDQLARIRKRDQEAAEARERAEQRRRQAPPPVDESHAAVDREQARIDRIIADIPDEELNQLAQAVMQKYDGNGAVIRVLTRTPPRECRLMKMEIVALRAACNPQSTEKERSA